jgi:hypothetical protein
VMIAQQGLERRHLLDVRDAWRPRRGQTPLILLRVYGDDEFQPSTSQRF